MPAPRGKMQKPVVQPPKPKPIPQPSAPAAPKKRQSGHGVIIAILCVFTALSLGLSIYLIANSASQRVSLRLRESDLEEREESLATLEQSLLDAQQELQSAKDELSQQAQTIEELQKNFTSAQSTVSQTQYDMTTQQAELERVTAEKEALDDSRFVKNGNTALDALLTYANADGSFRHTLDGEANEMATEQALYALAAAKLAESGKSLYKMDAPKADTQSGTFRDVVGHKNQKAIEALAEKGVINGMTADTFAPDAGLTRAQFCAIVVRALGLSQEKTAEFTDVLQSDWFCGFVGAASKAGIVNGVGNGKFNPQGAITREQAATMLARASKTLGLSGEAKDANAALKTYPDAAKASSYAKDALAFCAEHNILESDRTELRPGEAICRCEVAQMVWNLLAAAGEV